MEESGIDGRRAQSKNTAVPTLTPSDRKILGRKLRERRLDHQPMKWEQRDIAAQSGLSLGTIGAIETCKREVSHESFEKYAAVFETSVHALLHEDDVAQDPLLKLLNKDHLEIAYRYALALKVQREAVEALLFRDDPYDAPYTESIAEIVVTLHTLQRPDVIRNMLDLVQQHAVNAANKKLGDTR